MRRLGIATRWGAVLATFLVLAAGCTDDPKIPSAGVHPSPSGSPADAEDCTAALAVSGQATDDYLAQLNKWVAAKDEAGRRDALTAVRRIFATWSKDLLTRASQVDDPRLKAAITQYAGAVRAVSAGIKSPAGLERLENLDGSEIDVAASQLAEVCP
jgi:hypothetical protein